MPTKILIVTDVFPYPVSRNGFTENITNLLSNLKNEKDFEVDLVFIGDKNLISKEGIDYVRGIVNALFFRHLGNSKFIRLSKILYGKNLNIYKCYDILFFASFLSAYARFNFSRDQKTILYQADSRTLFWSKKSDLISKIKYFKYKLEQKALFKYFTKIIFVSELDIEEVTQYSKIQSKALVIPIGVNIPVNNDFQKPIKDIDCIFTGNFHFPPNSDAAIKFIKEVCPSLIAELSDIKIYFVGRFPSETMKNLALKYSNNIFVTGEVPSVSEYLSRSKIYISPIYWGSGMKNKIVQAMVHNLPIVCTKESTAGIQRKELFLISITAKDWVVQIKDLLFNPVSREIAGKNNYQEILAKYTYQKIVYNNFIPLFKQLTKIDKEK